MVGVALPTDLTDAFLSSSKAGPGVSVRSNVAGRRRAPSAVAE